MPNDYEYDGLHDHDDCHAFGVDDSAKCHPHANVHADALEHDNDGGVYACGGRHHDMLHDLSGLRCSRYVLVQELHQLTVA